MKKFNVLSTSLYVIGVCLLLAGCSKKEDPVPASVQGTALEFTVVNDLGNPVEGAVVDIYGSEEAWMSENPADVITSGETDAEGKATFSEMEAMKYYFSISQGERTVLANWEGIIATAQPLEADKLNKVNVEVKESVWAYLAAARISWMYDRIYLGSEDLTSEMEDCARDNTLTFIKNYIYKTSEGEMMCEHSTTQEKTAGYEIEGKAITLIDEEEGRRTILQVLSVTKDRLEVSSDGLHPDARLVFKAVYK